MKKRKMFTCSLVCVLLATIAFSGCGNNESKSEKKEIVNVVTNTTQEKNTEKDVSPVTKMEATTIGETPSEEQEVKTESKIDDVSVDEKVLVDQKDVKITAKYLDYSGWAGPELKLLIENNSSQALTFQVRNESINGFMVSSMMSENVGPGKKSNDGITFMSSDLEACGITTITDIEFSFHIFTSEGWDTYLDTDQVGLQTSAAGSYVQKVDDSGKTFYDKNGIRIIGKGLSTDDSVFGPGLIIYIENNTDKDFTVQARDTSVNGFMISTSMSQEVVTGKKAITALTFFQSSLEENGITKIESIETSFHVFSTDGWKTIVDTEPVTITF